VTKVRRIVSEKATAGLRSLVHKVRALALNNRAAVAIASPYGTASLATTGVLGNYKSGKSLSSQITQWHTRNSTSNRRCMGVWTRQLERYNACMEAQ